MSTRSADDPPYGTVGLDAAPLDRYEQVTLEDGILIYDTENETAWLQSDVTVELGATA